MGSGTTGAGKFEKRGIALIMSARKAEYLKNPRSARLVAMERMTKAFANRPCWRYRWISSPKP